MPVPYVRVTSQINCADVTILSQKRPPLATMAKPAIDNCLYQNCTGDPLHSRALAHSRAPLFTQPCSHCSHSRAPGEQWARLCVFTLQGCVQAARLCRGSPVIVCLGHRIACNKWNNIFVTMNNDFWVRSETTCQWFFTREVTSENHWQVASLVTQKSLFTVTHA